MLPLDLRDIEGFEWDSGNSEKSADKHGTTKAEAEQVFFNDPLLIDKDEKHSDKETPFHALGRTDAGRRLHITFTMRQNRSLIRIISARDMHRKERHRYAKET
jgi:hypothetical protein